MMIYNDEAIIWFGCHHFLCIRSLEGNELTSLDAGTFDGTPVLEFLCVTPHILVLLMQIREYSPRWDDARQQFRACPPLL